MNLNSDFTSRDNLVRDARDYTGVLDFNLDIPDNHVNLKSVESGSALRIRHRAANLNCARSRRKSAAARTDMPPHK